VTGEPLIQRKDDNAEVLRRRLQAYHGQTAPILAYYNQHKILSSIDAMQPIKNVSQKIDEALYKNIH
jgi:adenylate kinase